MPATLTYPGVYIEEVPSGVRTITGVATSIAAFVGRAPRGPVDEPVLIGGFADFERTFGDLHADYPLGYAVRDFYSNGGGQAIVVRLYRQPADDDDGVATLTVGNLTLAAASPGAWGSKLRGEVTPVTSEEARERLGLGPTDDLFNLTVRDTAPGGAAEEHRNLTVVDSARRVDKVLAAESSLVRWTGTWPPTTPIAAAEDATSEADTTVAEAAAELRTRKNELTDLTSAGTPDDDPAVVAAREAVTTAQEALTAAKEAVGAAEGEMQGSNGLALDQAAYEGSAEDKTGLHALAKADLFNLLSIPPDAPGGSTAPAVYQLALQLCVEHRALLLVDPPAAWTANPATAAAQALARLDDLGLSGVAARNAALYFPRLLEADPRRDGRIDAFVPSGAVAGVMARTDTQRGVWKAPAGLDAALNNVAGLDVNLDNFQNGTLNQRGINCLRFFPGSGRVVWGARTLRGADQLADEYKYVPVRRLALFIEESLYRGTQWVVFEPNDEPLWAQIRLNVGAFMQNLFRQGAFQGSSPRDAYFVKCDKETTTQNDINLGIVNIAVGFAPLKPAEFVVIKIQQMAGQIEA